MSYLWTSEFVSPGHPDKVADQIADAILDLYLANDPLSRVAVEVVVTTHEGQDRVILTGEVTSRFNDKDAIDETVRRVLNEIGYDREENSFASHRVRITNYIRSQSKEIAQAVLKETGEIGAGDQGIMFGFASTESETFMPLAHYISREIIVALQKNIAAGRVDGAWNSIFLPDAKSQVTIQYSDAGVPEHVDTVLISACHTHDSSLEQVQATLKDIVKEVQAKPYFYDGLFDDKTKYLFNPAGAWHIGGPASDTGLSGRKIVVDQYGPDCPIGGGSFSGKDPTKVDRSAAYAARYIAKNLVMGGYSNRAQVQLSYAIGVAEPISLRVNTNDPKLDQLLNKSLLELISLTPKSIIDMFDLRKPIYRKAAACGHFGDDSFPWEVAKLVEKLDARYCDSKGTLKDE
jgi:S-adenosylmethionine synthetase